jgi:hypothetical protein
MCLYIIRMILWTYFNNLFRKPETSGELPATRRTKQRVTSCQREINRLGLYCYKFNIVLCGTVRFCSRAGYCVATFPRRAARAAAPTHKLDIRIWCVAVPQPINYRQTYHKIPGWMCHSVRNNYLITVEQYSRSGMRESGKMKATSSVVDLN